jgi:hypothetical protein
MDVDVYIEDGVARTTIDQTFFNHTDYELEGVYSFPLPADAAIARLAMYVDGKLMEAGITERQEGREIYESIVYRRRDPALLEWMQGNEFRMRVFPLPAAPRSASSSATPSRSPASTATTASASRSPSSTSPSAPCATASTSRTAPSPSTPAASTSPSRRGRRPARRGHPQERRHRRGPRPHPLPHAKAPRRHHRRHGRPRRRLLDGPRPPRAPQSSQHTPRRWVVLHDTSASRSPAELAAQTRFLRHLLRELDEADRLSLVAFDSTLRDLPGGFTRVDKLDLAAVDNFLAREGRDHVGGTELGPPSTTPSPSSTPTPAPRPRTSSTSATASSAPPATPPARPCATASPAAARATFVAAALGDEVDLPLLDDLATATGGLRVQLTPGADLRWQALDLAAALNTARLHDLKARLLGPGDAPITGRTAHVSATR